MAKVEVDFLHAIQICFNRRPSVWLRVDCFGLFPCFRIFVEWEFVCVRDRQRRDHFSSTFCVEVTMIGPNRSFVYKRIPIALVELHSFYKKSDFVWTV